MNAAAFKLATPWEDVKEKMKANDIRLTDEDLEYVPGKEDELLERLEKKLNRSRHQLIAYIESISFNDDMAG